MGQQPHLEAPRRGNPGTITPAAGPPSPVPWTWGGPWPAVRAGRRGPRRGSGDTAPPAGRLAGVPPGLVGAVAHARDPRHVLGAWAWGRWRRWTWCRAPQEGQKENVCLEQMAMTMKIRQGTHINPPHMNPIHSRWGEALFKLRSNWCAPECDEPRDTSLSHGQTFVLFSLS